MVPLSNNPVERPKDDRIQPSSALSKLASGIRMPTAMTEPGTA